MCVPYQPLKKIKDWAEEDRPREKLLQKGKSVLTEAELLGILVNAGTSGHTAVDIARLILKSVGNDLHQLSKLNVSELARFNGIGKARAVTIVAALELGRRRRVFEDRDDLPVVSGSELAFRLISPHLLDLQHEEFWVLLLNRRNQVIRPVQVSVGGVAGTVADPKIIFKHALDNVSSSLILVHNHPSGNLQPSEADILLTRKLRDAGRLLDLPVLDHLIVCGRKYFSFLDEGMM